MSEKSKCACCSLNLLPGDFTMACSKCCLLYHDNCVSTIIKLPINKINVSKWACPSCKPRTGNADATPVRATKATLQAETSNITTRKKPSTGATLTVDLKDSSPVTSSQVQQIVPNAIDELMKHLNSTLAGFVNKELKSIKEEIGEIKTSINFLSHQYDDMKKMVLTKLDVVDKFNKENQELKINLRELDSKLNILEQQSRSSNIESPHVERKAACLILIFFVPQHQFNKNIYICLCAVYLPSPLKPNVLGHFIDNAGRVSELEDYVMVLGDFNLGTLQVFMPQKTPHTEGRHFWNLAISPSAAPIMANKTYKNFMMRSTDRDCSTACQNIARVALELSVDLY
ncbi:unnamed protein product [Leptidea sinapis]|uniref:PHD-type domain-containing protein n=1 Tax=Leptidea sinapis TaxID=189913 RepID=A0A5E4PTY3_9NEOP|nr:unnamed protein product [Leptidea sinapis]